MGLLALQWAVKSVLIDPPPPPDYSGGEDVDFNPLPPSGFHEISTPCESLKNVGLCRNNCVKAKFSSA